MQHFLVFDSTRFISVLYNKLSLILATETILPWKPENQNENPITYQKIYDISDFDCEWLFEKSDFEWKFAFTSLDSSHFSPEKR